MTASANDPRKFFRGSVAISGGRISSVLPATPDNGSDDRGTESENRSRRVIDAGGKLLMPGLINLHNHVAMSLMRNYADDLPLMEWLADRVWPFEAKLDGRRHLQLGAAPRESPRCCWAGRPTFVDMYWHADRVAEAALAQRNPGGRQCPAFRRDERTTVTFERDDRPAGRTLCRRRRRAHSGVRVAPHAPVYLLRPNPIREAL